MTQNTNLISIRAAPCSRNEAFAIALTVIALLGAIGAVGTAVAQSDQPTVFVTNSTTTSDDTTASNSTTTVDVVLTNAPNGLSGYQFDLTVRNAETAQIESASYPDRFGLTTEPETGANDSFIILEAADVEDAITPGATNVTLATVTLTGTMSGEITPSVKPRQFDDDDGSAFSPATQSGSVTGGGDETTGDKQSDSGVVTDEGPNTNAANQETFGSGSLPLIILLITTTLVAGLGLRRRS